MTMHVAAYGRKLTLKNPSWEMKARWEGRLSPEPETVAWIERMQPGQVFFDVGANVGRFSMLAACRGLKVFAFEPQAAQHAELCAAVRANGLDVAALCVAVHSRTMVGRIVPGRSAATFEPACVASDRQAVLAMTLDALAGAIGLMPDYIKIDVDGNEPDVLVGASTVLSRAQSVLIEVDPGAPGHATIVPTMRAAGFDYDQVQVDACTVPDGKFAGMANYIFTRRS